MVFSSSLFLLYFLPLFLIVYYAAAKPYKNFVILFFSVVFYAWGAPKFIFVLLATTFLDFYLVRWMDKSPTQLIRRLLLIMSVSINIGLLFYFKYCNFFIDNINVVFNAAGIKEITFLKVILPVGISFYTFETITYVADVYRRVHKPLTNFWDYQTYIILFPKLIAGPIIRYHDIAGQITDRSANENIDNKLTGFYRFCIGLGKKVLIANVVGAYADEVFNSDYNTLATSSAWLGILAYTFQIYFDFSGYSDMAIGIGKMIGFKFPENFNNPYVSQSITEFWRRWHITLGAWMRNYLYIPLGGNRVDSKSRLYFNLWIVFLASGFWHGASWNFLFWGAYHGTFLILDRLFLHDFYKRIGKFLSTLLTFLIVMTGWIFFRVEHFTDAILYITHLFSFSGNNAVAVDRELISILIIALLFSMFVYFEKGEKIQQAVYFGAYSLNKHFIMFFAAGLLFVLSLASVTSTGFNPFIYFRF